MTNLLSYIITSVTPGGDYTLTFTWDDTTTSTQTIAFGILTDEMGNTASQQLDTLVQDYATAYISGWQGEQQQAQERVPSSISAIIGKTQEVS